MKKRSKPVNCQVEPDYPDHQKDMVLMAFSDPNVIVHLAHPSCDKQYPHSWAGCGLVKDE